MTLRGVELMHRLSPEDFLQARTAFETAIARDPVSPRPHAWLAKWHVMRVAVGASDNAAADSAAATACAERALACDADDALALAVDAHGRGLVAARSRRRGAAPGAGARRESERAARLAMARRSPTHGADDGAEAVQCADRALSLSPLDPMIYYFNSLAGMANLIGECYERAIELSTRSLRENSLHTPDVAHARGCAGAFGASGGGARGDGHGCAQLEPALTAAAFARAIPGAIARRPARFIGALLEAGLPA